MNHPVGKRYVERLMPLGPNSRSDGSMVGSSKPCPSSLLRPHAQYGRSRTCPLPIFTILGILGQGQRNEEPDMPTTTPVDLSDSALWRNGFPDDLFTELRREQPIFHHELTDGVAKTVKRDFWMTTKHRHAQRIHRDTDSFTAVDGPLIQPIGVDDGSFPTIIHMDPPELTKRRRVMSHAFTPKRDRQARGGHPGAGRVDDRPAARGGRRRLDRRCRRRAADVGHRRHHRHPRRGPARDLRHARPDPVCQLAGLAVDRAGPARAVRQDLHLRARAHRGEAAQPGRRHLEHAGVRGGHRRER